MPYDETTINEFIALYEEIFEEQISVTDATLMLHKLVHLYRALIKSLPKDKEGEESKPLS